MKIKEAEIRENIAEYIKILDPNLKVVAQEHYIKMPNGRTAYVDILAKDKFGCFTLIELKKSDQTARSAIQQLMKYANMLKNKNRLEESQIRCVVISTVWRELEEAFDEYSRVSQYEFKGYSVVYKPNEEPIFQQIVPKYNSGDLSPLKNFIFFEFSEQNERDKAYADFTSTLELLPSCNSVIIKMDYTGDDNNIIHPYGFSWSMFTTDTDRLYNEISSLPVRELNDSHFDIEGILNLWQLDGAEYELRSKILLEQVRLNYGVGEYTGLALHSLNNTLSTWNHGEPLGVGDMFSDALFDSDDMLSMACGFSGDHPYGFNIKTTPCREYQFNMVRKKLNKFLSANYRWCSQVDYILNTLRTKDVADINVYNPLNFFGLMYDLKKHSSSQRVPYLIITIDRENGDKEVYRGLLAWTNKDRKPDSVKEAVITAYDSIDSLKARMISQELNEFDEKLSELYGLTYEVVTEKNNTLFSIQNDENSGYMQIIDSISTLNDFVRGNDNLIEEVDYLLNKDPSSNVKITF
ncbi:TPA: DUF91 domain-containing protein [Vibrio parahaemolyticus]|uniref:endonuclease NucS domain-containing protein n=1 Tax=Vibrio parahaemolyticus TaxID=670 RepID=UPI0032104EEA|nr:DUF91 domain-containing protein [Vibrio parahaemolyticus]HCH3681701.1 DUF91 domain-containing protein [Vibrio parahaemolyticus]